MLERAKVLHRRATVERRLLWIFGSPRSGSTWLLRLLGGVPGVLPVNEPLIGLHLAPFVCDRPGAFAADLDVDRCTFNRVARNSVGYFFAERHRSAWERPLGRLIRARFAAQGPGSLVAIQETNGSQGADAILRAVPRSGCSSCCGTGATSSTPRSRRTSPAPG